MTIEEKINVLEERISKFVLMYDKLLLENKELTNINKELQFKVNTLEAENKDLIAAKDKIKTRIEALISKIG